MAKQSRAISKGFSMIEIMVSVLVVAVGLLAVANFQGGLIGQSSTNKARAEATALAQARIEQLRNYTNDVNSQADFDALFAATGGFANDATVNGVNAQFTRQENVAVDGDMREVTVRVAWTGSNGRAQQVVLDTELSYEPPRSTGDIAREDEGLIPSPTGRAVLGEGYLPTGAPTTPNGDGTAIYDAGDGDLRLALGNVIVLTLKDACVSGNSCIDFVTISGRIYIDKASQAQITPGEVFVKASDAAFCQRYWTDTNGNTNTVLPNTASTISTTNGDYEYFDYTCYLGGGWFGNIGLILANGISQRDKACMGDPITINAWEEPVIAARRAYRGMLYKHDGQGGKVEYGNNLTRYWSIGVKDALTLPAVGDAGHDFILADMNPGDTTGDKCLTNGTMLRPDSLVNLVLGDLFAGVPTDFVCLNPDNVDAYDSAVFGAETYCPYDPTEPPTLAHQITGEIKIKADADFSDLVDAIFVMSTDGPGNCSTNAFAYDAGREEYLASYSCNVFDWGSGWTGSVMLFANYTEFDCDKTQDDYSGLTASDDNEDFNCSAINADPGDPVNFYQISGSTTLPPGNYDLTGADMTGGSCTIAGNQDYNCELYSSDTSWSGLLDFDASNGYWCTADTAEAAFDNSTGTATFSNLAPGSYTLDLNVIKTNTCNL